MLGRTSELIADSVPQRTSGGEKIDEEGHTVEIDESFFGNKGNTIEEPMLDDVRLE